MYQYIPVVNYWYELVHLRIYLSTKVYDGVHRYVLHRYVLGTNHNFKVYMYIQEGATFSEFLNFLFSQFPKPHIQTPYP